MRVLLASDLALSSLACKEKEMNYLIFTEVKKSNSQNNCRTTEEMLQKYPATQGDCMLKLLFLDMDGAGANSMTDIDAYWRKMEKKSLPLKAIQRAYDKKFNYGLEAIFPRKARLVSKIIADTDAKIVWSTTWRLCEPYKNNMQLTRRMLLKHNMPGDALIGYTPDLGPEAFRCQEITAFLAQHYPDQASCRCAVLDDWDEAGYELPGNCRFFQTNEQYGLTFSIARKIIKYLNA